MVWCLALVLIVMTAFSCERPPDPTATSKSAPRDWARRHGVESGAPRAGTPQQVPSQRGDRSAAAANSARATP